MWTSTVQAWGVQAWGAIALILPNQLMTELLAETLYKTGDRLSRLDCARRGLSGWSRWAGEDLTRFLD